ncbi:chromosome condensation complex Condensin, subunit G [Polyrhizophydium stewartii]|uniref:Chromosome condensation complex Condensin, subunit G n=1 Tax=Polyrhizophydium stewartii TaxID=2732419 RepID=A0ABR4MVL7_9FUNG
MNLLTLSLLRVFKDSADEADAAQIRVQLLSLLSHDTSADVRKAVLWNLSLTLETAEALVERARDIDPAVRKLVFAKLTLEQEAADLLSIDLRRQLLKTGLDDRDANVRAACIKLLSSGWIKQAGGINGFVESLDVRGSYEAASAIVLSLFRHNPSLRFESRDFQWQSLTCEAAFLAHHFAVHLKSANDDAGFDLLVPSLSDLVGIMQGYMSQIVSEEDETSRLELEFVIQELIALCINLDLCDETGRRLLSEFLDSALVEMDLPPAGIAHVVRLGLQLSDGTSEYVSKLVLLLGRIRESYGLEPEPEPMGSEQPQDRNWSETEAVAMLKCLDTVHGVVQLLDFTYSEHGLMYELLEKYVFPCTGSSILAISKLALSCLAQCSLLDKTLAAANLDIFLAYLESHDERALGSFQYFVDAIMHYGKDALAEKQVQAAMRTFLKSNNSERLSVAVEGFCKLLLLQRITDTQDLLAMVILFYHPSTSQIQKLRQSLSYFLPAFGHLLPAELAKIFVPAILALSSLPRAEATGMLPPLAVASQIVDWIAAAKPDTDASDTTFTDLVEECLKSAIHGQPMNRRFLCQVLPKLPLPGSLSAEQIAHIDSLTQQLQSLVTDTQSTLALKRFRKPLDAETGDAAQLKTVTDSVADLSLA